MKAFIQRSARDDVFGSDQLDAVSLTWQLAANGVGEFGIGVEAGGEVASCIILGR